MRSKHFLAMTLLGGGLGVLGLSEAGCGSSSPATSTGGQTTTTHHTTTGTTSSSGTTTATGTGGAGGAGGGSAAGCHMFGCATPITAGATPLAGTLADAKTPDFYSFSGTKGDRILITATAFGLVTNAMADGSITDTVVTLYLPDKSTVWAVNDDGFPRTSTDSVLYTELPQTGTYYFTVEDCNLASATPATSCAPVSGINNFAYQAFYADLTASKNETVGAASPPTVVTYTPVPKMTGSYYDSTLDGDIPATTTTQYFSVTPPSNTTVSTSARSRGYFWVQSVGNTDGTGTLLDVVMTATDAQNHILARADQQYFTNGDDPTNSSLEFSFPLDDQFGNKLGSTYNVAVSVSSKTSTITPTQNFYIVDHVGGPYWYGQPETEGPAGSGMNDTGATAQLLSSPSGETGAWFVDGNLSSPTDVDFYKFVIPAGDTVLDMFCFASRNGSGIKGFTAEAFSDAAGTMSLGKIGPETVPASTDLMTPTAGLKVTAGATIYLKISGTGQDATNLGTYYRCEIDAGT